MTAGNVAYIHPDTRQLIKSRAAQIALALLGEPNHSLSNSRELRFGRKGSLAVAVEGPKAGVWYDHENGVGGDVLDLIRRMKGTSLTEAGAIARDLLGVVVSVPPARPSARVVDLAVEREARQRVALEIWQGATDIGGSIVERYLEHRKLVLPAGMSGRVLRFQRACPFGDSRHPAMVALLRDIKTDEPQAIHRTALTAVGHKIGRMVLGPKSGAAIKLSDDIDVAVGLAIGEGIETVFAGMMLDFSPAWSVIDADGIAKFPVLSGIEALTIFVDHDVRGQESARQCSKRWTDAGNEVRRVTPIQVGSDMNDLTIRAAA